MLDYFELQVDAERSCHHHPWQSDATLGGNHQGYLEVWVKADIAIYISHENKKTGFESRQYVTESAKLIVELGEIRDTDFGKTMDLAPKFELGNERVVREWFEYYYSTRFRTYSKFEESDTTPSKSPASDDRETRTLTLAVRQPSLMGQIQCRPTNTRPSLKVKLSNQRDSKSGNRWWTNRSLNIQKPVSLSDELSRGGYSSCRKRVVVVAAVQSAAADELNRDHVAASAAWLDSPLEVEVQEKGGLWRSLPSGAPYPWVEMAGLSIVYLLRYGTADNMQPNCRCYGTACAPRQFVRVTRPVEVGVTFTSLFT